MTTSPSEPADDGPDDSAPSEPGAIDDDQLPEDLQPTEDNPLARSPDQEGDEAIGQRSPADETDAGPPAN